MYKVDSSLLDKFNERVQKPSPLVYITRNKTAITSQRLWEKRLITSTVGTRSSIAVRRPEGSFTADMIFTAQVENGTATIRYAEPLPNLNNMKWNIVTTISNVSELSIMFDGYMKMVDGIVETYTTGTLPFVFYVDSTNSLKYLSLDDESIFGDVSDDAVNVATVRGLYAEAIDMDDGIFCFYTNTLGELWEAKIISGVVTELTQISLLPEGVTTWEDVWVGFTFDYRIVLQLKGDDGVVYTLISKSRPSGYSVNEYIRLSNMGILGTFGVPPPVLINAENTDSTRIKLTFDTAVYNTTPGVAEYFRVQEAIYGDYFYPISSSYGENINEVYLTFEDFSWRFTPFMLEYLGGSNLSGVDFEIEPFTIEPLINLNPNQRGSIEYINISDMTIAGEMKIAFDGKLFGDEYLRLSGMNINATNIEVQFYQRYANEYLALSAMNITGQYCDVNGIPI